MKIINPYSSPWNKKIITRIQDTQLYWRFASIKKYLKINPIVREGNGYLEINNICYIAKNSNKMRLISHLDWCHYDAKDIADAINTGTLEEYYEQQLKDSQSDSNIWKDIDKEMELKTVYAVRSKRASKI